MLMTFSEKLIQFSPALFINLVSLATTKKNTEKMLLPIGAYMVSGPTGKKKS